MTLWGGICCVFGVVAEALGGWDMPLKALLTFMVVDFITGLLVAGVFKTSTKSDSGAIESNACMKGIVRKGLILLIVLIAVMLDKMLNINAARNIIITFFIGNEGISITENLGLMGVPLPKWLKKNFQAFKDKSDTDEIENK